MRILMVVAGSSHFRLSAALAAALIATNVPGAELSEIKDLGMAVQPAPGGGSIVLERVAYANRSEFGRGLWERLRDKMCGDFPKPYRQDLGRAATRARLQMASRLVRAGRRGQKLSRAWMR